MEAVLPVSDESVLNRVRNGGIVLDEQYVDAPMIHSSAAHARQRSGCQIEIPGIRAPVTTRVRRGVHTMPAAHTCGLCGPTHTAPEPPHIDRRWPFPSDQRRLPSSTSWMAMLFIAVMGDAPCRCFRPGLSRPRPPIDHVLDGPAAALRAAASCVFTKRRQPKC